VTTTEFWIAILGLTLIVSEASHVLARIMIRLKRCNGLDDATRNYRLSLLTKLNMVAGSMLILSRLSSMLGAMVVVFAVVGAYTHMSQWKQYPKTKASLVQKTIDVVDVFLQILIGISILIHRVSWYGIPTIGIVLVLLVNLVLVVRVRLFEPEEALGQHREEFDVFLQEACLYLVAIVCLSAMQ
jgi:NhaP-type Na+/H+ or K+/H+ antiporter